MICCDCNAEDETVEYREAHGDNLCSACLRIYDEQRETDTYLEYQADAFDEATTDPNEEDEDDF